MAPLESFFSVAVMRLEIYSHALVQKYRTSLVTKAVFFQLILFVLLVISPLLIAYRTSGFWIKEKYYTESPYVTYRHETIVYVKTDASRSLVWTTYSELNSVLSVEGSLSTPLVESAEIDNDFDGKNDFIDFSVSFPLNSGESVTSVNAYLFFNYQLKLFSRVEVLGLALIQEQTESGAHKLSISGDLNFNQKINLPHKGSNTDFAGELITDQSANFDLTQLVQKYNSRNLTTELAHNFRGWQEGASSDNIFVLDLHVNYPEQTLRYEPGFLEELKFAWIQYLSIFVIFLFAFDRLKTFVFQNQVFPTVPVAAGTRRKL